MTDLIASAPTATATELMQLLRLRLGPASGRRIGPAHVAVLQLLIDMRERALPVSEIHQALMARGDPIKLSGVYRALEVLEEAGMVRAQWQNSFGRPARAFELTDAWPAAAGAGSSAGA